MSPRGFHDLDVWVVVLSCNTLVKIRPSHSGGKRLILNHVLRKSTTTQKEAPNLNPCVTKENHHPNIQVGNPGVTPLPAPFSVLGSRVIHCVWKIEWKFKLLAETTYFSFYFLPRKMYCVRVARIKSPHRTSTGTGHVRTDGITTYLRFSTTTARERTVPGRAPPHTPLLELRTRT